SLSAQILQGETNLLYAQITFPKHRFFSAIGELTRCFLSLKGSRFVSWTIGISEDLTMNRQKFQQRLPRLILGLTLLTLLALSAGYLLWPNGLAG
ncbi:MAG: hypothetical protein AAFR26_18740, partial [Cyanobacteria bacterium J06626_4]